jgi:hypothetical protein
MLCEKVRENAVSDGKFYHFLNAVLGTKANARQISLFILLNKL